MSNNTKIKDSLEAKSSLIPSNEHLSVNELYSLISNTNSNEKLRRSQQEKFKQLNNQHEFALDAKDLHKKPQNLEEESKYRKKAYDLCSSRISKWQTIVESNNSADQLKFPMHNDDNRLKIFDASKICFSNTKKMSLRSNFVAKSSLIQKTRDLLRIDSLKSNRNTTNSHNDYQNDKFILAQRSLKSQIAEQMKITKHYEEEMRQFKNLVKNANLKNRLHRQIKSKRFRRLQRLEKNKKLSNGNINSFSAELSSNNDGINQTTQISQKFIDKCDTLRAKERFKNAKILKKKSGKRKLLHKGKFDANIRAEVALKQQKSREILNTKLSCDNLKLFSDFVEEKENISDIYHDKSVSLSLDTNNCDMMIVNKKHHHDTDDYESESNKSTNDNLENNEDYKNPWISKKNNQSNSSLSSSVVYDSKSKSDQLNNQKKQMKKIDQSLNVVTAFASDDVVAHFEEEKRRDLDEDAQKLKESQINSNLLGWGTWSGPGLTHKSNKKNFIGNSSKSKDLPRSDSSLEHVRIFQDVDRPIKNLQVDKLPINRFKNINEFESFTSIPLGSEWNTPKSFDSLNRPRVDFLASMACLPLRENDYFSKVNDV